MIQPFSGLISTAAQSSRAAADVKESPEIHRTEGEEQSRSHRSVMDEYIPEEKQEPSGLYWMGRGENGQPQIYFDDPEQDKNLGDSEPKADDGKKADTCTGNTDQVDREVERLKKQKEQLERQINSETDETKKKELESKLSQVVNELNQKDNDAYRRQHTVFS